MAATNLMISDQVFLFVSWYIWSKKHFSIWWQQQLLMNFRWGQMSLDFSLHLSFAKGRHHKQPSTRSGETLMANYRQWRTIKQLLLFRPFKAGKQPGFLGFESKTSVFTSKPISHSHTQQVLDQQKYYFIVIIIKNMIDYKNPDWQVGTTTQSQAFLILNFPGHNPSRQSFHLNF